MEFSTSIEVPSGQTRYRQRSRHSEYVILATNDGFAFCRCVHTGIHRVIGLDELVPIPIVPAEVWVCIDTETGKQLRDVGFETSRSRWMDAAIDGVKWVKYVAAENQG